MADGSATVAPRDGHATEGESSGEHPGRPPSADLIVMAAATVVGAAATALPSGALRALLSLPMILFVPGYLLLQAAAWDAGDRRWFQAAVSIGLSPPLVGGLALLTAIVPGGFKPVAIVASVTVACLLLLGVAFARRFGIPSGKAARKDAKNPQPSE